MTWQNNPKCILYSVWFKVSDVSETLLICYDLAIWLRLIEHCELLIIACSANLSFWQVQRNVISVDFSCDNQWVIVVTTGHCVLRPGSGSRTVKGQRSTAHLHVSTRYTVFYQIEMTACPNQRWLWAAFHQKCLVIIIEDLGKPNHLDWSSTKVVILNVKGQMQS